MQCNHRDSEGKLDYTVEDVGLTCNERGAFCSYCHEEISDLVENECPHCKKNPIEIDDYGLTCCNECYESRPDWKKKMGEAVSEDRSLEDHPTMEVQ